MFKRMLYNIMALSLVTLLLIGHTSFANAQPKVSDNLTNKNFKKGEQKLITNNKPNTTLSKPTLNSKRNYYKDQLIIKYKASPNNSNINQLYSDNKLKKVKNNAKFNLELIKTSPNSNLDDIIKKLKQNPNIEAVEKNYIYKTDGLSNDPFTSQLWGLQNTGQNIKGAQGTAGVDVRALEAWKITSGKSDVVIGVIDTGIDINHPDIKNNIFINTKEIAKNGIDDDGNGYIDDINGWDFYNNDNTIYDVEDGDYHGTHVAGIIAASINNSIGITGVAPNVKILPLKFIGPYGGNTYDAVSALAYAKDMGVKITNNSWGSTGYSTLLENAIRDFNGLFVIASGNYGINNDSNTSYPIGYELDNIISVAAINNNGTIAKFSNYGIKTVDVAAPGVGILSSVPREPALPTIIGNTYGTSKSIFQGFSSSIIKTDVEKKALYTKVFSFLNVNTNDSILVVKDDGSSYGRLNVSSSYEVLIKALGYKNVTVIDTSNQYPALATLKKYSAIVWYKGEDFEFNSVVQSTLCDYLSGTGKLYLSGEYTGELLGGSQLLDKYMGANFLYSDFNRFNATKLIGITSTSFNGLSLNFNPGHFVTYFNTRTSSASPNAKALASFNEELTYNSSYEYYNGTSMAAPYVTGIAALLYSNGNTNTLRIKDALIKSITPLPKLNGLIKYPGIVNAVKALTAQFDDDIPGIVLNPTQKGLLDSVKDIDDVYSISLKAGDNITVKLTDPSTGDFDLHLYNTTAESVKSSSGILISSEGITSAESITYTATSTGTYYIDVYSFSGYGEYTLTYTLNSKSDTFTIEDNSKELSYVGSWSLLRSPSNYSGGTARELTNNGSVSYTGVFKSIKWLAYKGPNQGIAKVYVDGNLTDTIDLYSSTTIYKQVVLDKSVSYGNHTVSIVWTGLKNVAVKKGATNINIDSLLITNVNPTSNITEN